MQLRILLRKLSACYELREKLDLNCYTDPHGMHQALAINLISK